ncbi:MAG: hypothetical protein GY719_10670 [bacterium]|nr:hypothetical protein [bacterium]
MNALRRILPLLCLVITLVGSNLWAQESRTFREERRITVIDLLVAFEGGAMREWATESAVPGDLLPEDFEVRYERQPRKVIAVDAEGGPWQVVIFFDAVLSSSGDMRWAAGLLADHADALASLGEVAIVVADPEPRSLLSATDDRDRLHATLSQVAASQAGSDDLLAQRAEVVGALRDPAAEPAEDLLGAAAGEEARIVRQRHDDLLLELTDREVTRARRLLIWAGGGYDANPGAFYESLSGHASAGPTIEAVSHSDLTMATETLARTLAAYGWVTLPLVRPEPDPLKEGIRIGKLLLTGPGADAQDQQADWEEYNRTVVWLFGARYEGKRKPKRAEAFLELGAALEGQGKLTEAEDALRKAIYHFAGDPRTASQQAKAFVHLGRVLDGLEKTQESTAAFGLARRLDRDYTAAATGPVAALLDPLAPLGTVARATAGGVVRSGGALVAALDDLQHRVRVTYQVAGEPDGELHHLEALFTGGQRRLTHPRWARSATPSQVAAARARRLLGGAPARGPLELSAEITGGQIHLAVEPPEVETEADDTPETTLRLTLAYGAADTEPTVEHRPLGPQTGRDETWTYQLGVDPPEEFTWLAVLVEDLNTGDWGASLLELP